MTKYIPLTDKIRRGVIGLESDRFGILSQLGNNPVTIPQNSVVLNFYEFHILIQVTSKIKNIYSNLLDGFFDKLSLQKDKLYFIGYIESDNFFLTMIFYKFKNKNIGLLVKKTLKKAFFDAGFNLIEPKIRRDFNNPHTLFVVS